MNKEQFDKLLSLILPGIDPIDVTDKSAMCSQYVMYMINRTASMFEWRGLPETIPQRFIELTMQLRGYCAIAKYNDNLYAFFGGLGGEPDVYYMPTVFTVANPALNYSANLRIGKDCIIIPNDTLYMGLMPMFTRYATMLSENLVSFRVAMINSRITDLISASDDRTLKSAKGFLDDVEKGKLGVISSNEFLEGIKTAPYGSDGHYNTITSLIELHQYYKASWYNEIGLNANYNMKRESISRGESQLNNDALLPLVDDMLNNRKIAAEQVNDLFGTEISVKLSSSWDDNIQEIEAELDALKQRGEQNDTGARNDIGDGDNPDNSDDPDIDGGNIDE